VPFVFMTAVGDIRTIVGAMKEGAIDLLPKPFTAEQLNTAINRAIQSAEVTDHNLRGLDDIWRMAAGLTPREAEVLRLVAEGHTSKDIASMLDLGLQTVRTYRKTLMKKIGVTNVAGLTQVALAAGLTSWGKRESKAKEQNG